MSIFYHLEFSSRLLRVKYEKEEIEIKKSVFGFKSVILYLDCFFKNYLFDFYYCSMLSVLTVMGTFIQ